MKVSLRVCQHWAKLEMLSGVFPGLVPPGLGFLFLFFEMRLFLFLCRFRGRCFARVFFFCEFSGVPGDVAFATFVDFIFFSYQMGPSILTDSITF